MLLFLQNLWSDLICLILNISVAKHFLKHVQPLWKWAALHILSKANVFIPSASSHNNAKFKSSKILILFKVIHRDKNTPYLCLIHPPLPVCLFFNLSFSLSISAYGNDQMCGNRRRLCEANKARHQSFHHNWEVRRPKDSLKRHISGY